MILGEVYDPRGGLRDPRGGLWQMEMNNLFWKKMSK